MLAKRLDEAIKEALSRDLWGVIVQPPPCLRPREHASVDRNAMVLPDDSHVRFATFRQALVRTASLEIADLGTSAFVHDHFFSGVIRMVTVCQEYHRNVSSTLSGPLVAALDASNSCHGDINQRDKVIRTSWGLDEAAQLGPLRPERTCCSIWPFSWPCMGARSSGGPRDALHARAEAEPSEGNDYPIALPAAGNTTAQESSSPHSPGRNRGSRGQCSAAQSARDAGPPHASSSGASTSRAAQQAGNEIQRTPWTLAAGSHLQGPACVSSVPAARQDIEFALRGHMAAIHAISSAPSVDAAQATAPPPGEPAGDCELGAPVSGSSTRSQARDPKSQ